MGQLNGWIQFDLTYQQRSKCNITSVSNSAGSSHQVKLIFRRYQFNFRVKAIEHVTMLCKKKSLCKLPIISISLLSLAISRRLFTPWLRSSCASSKKFGSYWSDASILHPYHSSVSLLVRPCTDTYSHLVWSRYRFKDTSTFEIILGI